MFVRALSKFGWCRPKQTISTKQENDEKSNRQTFEDFAKRLNWMKKKLTFLKGQQLFLKEAQNDLIL